VAKTTRGYTLNKLTTPMSCYLAERQRRSNALLYSTRGYTREQTRPNEEFAA
jgi:hypothetical protein